VELGSGSARENRSGGEHPVHARGRLGQHAELALETLLAPREHPPQERDPARVHRGGALGHEAARVRAERPELDSALRHHVAKVRRCAEAHEVPRRDEVFGEREHRMDVAARSLGRDRDAHPDGIEPTTVYL
jgi:hypothetical protein